MRVAALTIGQTPRSDLVNPLIARLPDAEFVQIGALDGVTADNLPAVDEAAYPLQTRLSSGETVYISQELVSDRLNEKLDALDHNQFDAAILLCAGTFGHLNSASLPLIKPFDVGKAMLEAIIATNIGVIAPFEAQEPPIRERWHLAGFKPTVWTADVNQVDAAFEEEINAMHQQHNFRAVVVDFVGHPESAVSNVQRVVPVPVIDLGQVAVDMLVARLK